MKALLYRLKESHQQLCESFEKFHPYSFAHTTYLPIFKLMKNNFKFDHVLKSRYVLYKLVERTNSHNYKVLVKDTKSNQFKYKKVFIKSIDILSDELCERMDVENMKLRDMFLPDLDLDELFDNIHSKRAPYIVEILTTFLLSECVSNDEILHFPLFYGSISFIEKEDDNKYNSYNHFAMERMTGDFTHIAYEKDELKDLKKLEDEFYSKKSRNDKSGRDSRARSSNSSRSSGNRSSNSSNELIYKTDQYLLGYIFQVIYSINFMWKKYNVTHNDLHINNVMFKHTNKKTIEYRVSGKRYIVPTNKKLIKIIDFGRACLRYRNYDFNNNIFNKNGDCSSQYYFSNNRDIHKKNVKPRPINDVIMFLNDVYTRLNLDDHPNIVRFCERYMVDRDGEFITFDNDSFDKYIDISHINWKVKNIDVMLKDKAFNKFKK